MVLTVSHVPVASQSLSMAGNPASAVLTTSIESNAVTKPLTTGRPPCVSTGEWRPTSETEEIEATFCATGSGRELDMIHTMSPTTTSFAFLSVEQHLAPTARWCSEVRFSLAFASVTSETKAYGVAASAIERIETSSLLTEPSVERASTESPGLRESMRACEPSGLVTMAFDGKHEIGRAHV